jgi:parvulin-like peptidyl-prolyl isomerase
MSLASGAVLFAQGPLRQDPSAVVATVEGRNITNQEVREILAYAPPQLVNFFQQDPAGALMQWYVMQHLGKEGEAMKLDQQSPLKERLESIRLNFLAEERLNLEANAYSPKPAEIEAFYQKNQGRYQRVRVSGIYLKFKPTGSQGTSASDLAAAAAAILSAGQIQRSEDEAKRLADDLMMRLRAGESIATLAQQHSEDLASKAQGGDIGYVSQSSDFPTEFKTGVMALTQGTIATVRQAGGIWVVRAEERNTRPLNEVSNDILLEVRKTHLDDYMKGLNARFRPVIKDPTLIAQPIGK